MQAPPSRPSSYSFQGSWRGTYYSDTPSTTTDFERLKQKPVAGPEFYDRSLLSRRVALFGLFISVAFSIACIIGSVEIFLSKNAISAGVIVVPLGRWWQRESVSLGLNLLVTTCTEATGYVHSVALRSALASERRLRFNTNLRLLDAAKGVLNPNGTLCNFLMALLLIISYSSSILVTLSVNMDPTSDEQGSANPPNLEICMSDVPLLVLGVSLLLQAVIAFAGMTSADILTWSSSPFDITAALVHNTQVIPVPGRCMRGVKDADLHGPTAPGVVQPSAWSAHSSVRKVVITLWTLVIACLLWGLIVALVSAGSIRDALNSWSFLPNPQSYVKAYTIPLPGRVAWFYWVVYYLNMGVIQGPMTLALHCTELVANVIRDEKAWRCATTRKGAKVAMHPLAPVFGSWLNVVLLCAKPVFHWMLGLAISLEGTASSGFLTAISVSMFPVQILNLAAVLFIFSLTFTFVAYHWPEGAQPAAYGHIQTLANLIDEWSPVMWWGDKPASNWSHFRHAGEWTFLLCRHYLVFWSLGPKDHWN
ncbi:hypothetical protein V8B97DRAFT_2032240 [Scleroderma yunnanense]